MHCVMVSSLRDSHVSWTRTQAGGLGLSDSNDSGVPHFSLFSRKPAGCPTSPGPWEKWAGPPFPFFTD